MNDGSETIIVGWIGWWLYQHGVGEPGEPLLDH